MIAQAKTANLGNPQAANVWRVMEEAALFICIASLPVQLVAPLPGTSVTITKLAGALLIALVVLRRLTQRRLPLPRTQIDGGVLGFGLACLLSAITTVDRQASFLQIGILVQYGLLYYCAFDVACRPSTSRFVPRLFVATAAISGLGAVLAFKGLLVKPTVFTVIPNSRLQRLCFGMPDANEQAMLFLFAMSFLLFAPELWCSAKNRILAGTATLGVAAGLLLAMSRTAWLCAALLVFARLVFLKARLRGLAVLVLVTMTLGVSLVIAKPIIFERAIDRVREALVLGDASVASRIAYNATYVQTAIDGGVFGHGVGTTDLITKGFVNPMGRTLRLTIHSVPLVVWLETGWLGALAFLWLWSSVVAVLWIGLRRSSGAERALIGAYAALAASYAVVSLVMPFLYRSSLPILLGCAIAAAAPHLAMDPGHARSSDS